MTMRSAMRQGRSTIAGGFAWAAIAGALFFLAACAAPARAQVSEKEIIDALTPPPLTRSLSVPGQPPVIEPQRDFIEGLRRRTRPLSASEREQVIPITAERPSIDLEVYFDFDSTTITTRAEPQLSTLGRALVGPELKGIQVLLSGHTDAHGSELYNQGLSERRAEAVRRFLIEKFQLAAASLSTAGYGKRTLKNRDKPFAAENRRVQIVNLASATEAER